MKRGLVPSLLLALSMTSTLLLAHRPFWFTLTWVLLPAYAWMARRRFPLRPELVLIVFLALSALAAPLLRFQGPAMSSEPNAFHPLGTDLLDRDILTRILYGNRNSILIAAFGSGLACFFGLLASGLMALGPRLFRRFWDGLLQALLSIPLLVYFLLGLAFLEPGPLSLTLLFGFTLWPELARMVQARLLELKSAEFVQVARMRGDGEVAIFIKEALPNLGPVLMANFLITLVNAVLLESILGYLGLGLKPGVPSLGRMIRLGVQTLDTQPSTLLVSMVVLVGWLAGLRALLSGLDHRHRPLQVQ